MVKEVIVFRYGHRVVRDLRVTTHVCLVSRALNASKIIIDGFYDKELEDTISKINSLWGGNFKVEFTDNWKQSLKSYKKEGYCLIHLTMYGKEIYKKIKSIKRKNKIMVIIGSQKVPKEVYEISEYNISIGNQPHSEIAALAIFLNKIMKDKTMYANFKNAKIKINPSNSNKDIIKTN